MAKRGLLRDFSETIWCGIQDAGHQIRGLHFGGDKAGRLLGLLLQGFWMGALGSAFFMSGVFSSDLNSPDLSVESTENNW